MSNDHFQLTAVKALTLHNLRLTYADYALLQGKPPSAALGYPFFTSLLDISLAVKYNAQKPVKTEAL